MNCGDREGFLEGTKLVFDSKSTDGRDYHSEWADFRAVGGGAAGAFTATGVCDRHGQRFLPLCTGMFANQQQSDEQME